MQRREGAGSMLLRMCNIQLQTRRYPPRLTMRLWKGKVRPAPSSTAASVCHQFRMVIGSQPEPCVAAYLSSFRRQQLVHAVTTLV